MNETSSPWEVPTRLGDAVRDVAGHLRQAGIETSRLDARLLVAHAAGVPSESAITLPERELSEKERDSIFDLTVRRVARVPMSHILGEREFWSMAFEVTPDTLTPRPDTESLVETLLVYGLDNDRRRELTILDLGTGTGCILLALLSELPNATGLGIDRSNKVLSVAKRNALRHGMEARAVFKEGNWFDGLEDTFDIVVSNPPYIPTDDITHLEPEVAIYEPKPALDGGVNGLSCFHEISNKAQDFLKPGGVICLEVGMGQATNVRDIFMKAGFSDVRAYPDLSGQYRVVMATFTK